MFSAYSEGGISLLCAQATTGHISFDRIAYIIIIPNAFVVLPASPSCSHRFTQELHRKQGDPLLIVLHVKTKKADSE
jgi:hypothetical protein